MTIITRVVITISVITVMMCRPLILLRHQMEYSYLSPAVPGVRLRTIRLQRSPGHSLGFAVRGGEAGLLGLKTNACRMPVGQPVLDTNYKTLNSRVTMNSSKNGHTHTREMKHTSKYRKTMQEQVTTNY